MGYTGVLPSHPARCSGRTLQTAKRAPEAPAGSWSGWSAGSGRPVRPVTTPAGPGRGSCPSLSPPRADAASWPIKARLRVISSKVSQNGGVSLKYVEKAYHSPCSQNGPQKSPLEIPGFPFSAAFSHKELMAYFDLRARFSVKTTKCRQNVHQMSRERVARYPHDPRSKLLLGIAPSSGSARYSQRGRLFLETRHIRVPGGYRNEACGRSILVDSEVILRSILGQF